jgi:putative membrane protein
VSGTNGARLPARVAFGGHLALIAFSTAAMVTILAAPPGPWLQEEPNATIMRLSFRYAGPTYVALGAAAALLHLSGTTGWRAAWRLAVAAAAVSLGAELLGTSTGLPFGEYHYSELLGPRVLGRVPWPIPVSWFYMLTACLVIVARVRPAARDDGPTRWRWAMVAGLLLLAWDVSMDPAMVRTGHWAWGRGEMFRSAGVPGWIGAFFTRPMFYGMPLGNWFGWLLTGTIIARLMLSIVPPAVWSARVASSRLPVLLYLANGVMPVALCLREELWWPAAAGAAAMVVPATLALKRTAPTRAESPLATQPA